LKFGDFRPLKFQRLPGIRKSIIFSYVGETGERNSFQFVKHPLVFCLLNAYATGVIPYIVVDNNSATRTFSLYRYVE